MWGAWVGWGGGWRAGFAPVCGEREGDVAVSVGCFGRLGRRVVLIMDGEWC